MPIFFSLFLEAMLIGLNLKYNFKGKIEQNSLAIEEGLGDIDIKTFGLIIIQKFPYFLSFSDFNWTLAYSVEV